jgi:uncharacterized protein (UPF0276 family)
MRAKLAVGGSLRTALGESLLVRARAWKVAEFVPESWDPDDANDVRDLGELSEVCRLLPHSLALNVLGDAPTPIGIERWHRWRSILSLRAISDHFCWTAAGGHAAGVFLPPFEAADTARARIELRREQLGAALVLENIAIASNDWDFVRRYHELFATVAQAAAIPVLLDIENLWLDSAASGLPLRDLLSFYDGLSVQAYHVAGGEQVDGAWLDTHSANVRPAVVELLVGLAATRPAPIIYERDYALDADLIANQVAALAAAVNIQPQRGPLPEPT